MPIYQLRRLRENNQPDSSDWTPHLSRDQWLHAFAGQWRQGEHAAIIGPTGTGKTTLASELLGIRRYVVALAVKRHDDTLDLFTSQHPVPWRVISRWPPRYDDTHVVVWLKPKALASLPEQAEQVYGVLDKIFTQGGWALFLDDVGYIAGQLGLGKAIATLLSQGRSSRISVVSAFTQPTSIAQRIPSETWRQVRYIMVFRYRNRRDQQAIADMVGYDWREVARLMGELGPHDFLVFSDAGVSVVGG